MPRKNHEKITKKSQKNKTLFIYNTYLLFDFQNVQFFF